MTDGFLHWKAAPSQAAGSQMDVAVYLWTFLWMFVCVSSGTEWNDDTHTHTHTHTSKCDPTNICAFHSIYAAQVMLQQAYQCLLLSSSGTASAAACDTWTSTLIIHPSSSNEQRNPITIVRWIWIWKTKAAVAAAAAGLKLKPISRAATERHTMTVT